MKWRVVVELAGADGTVQSHEISVGGCGTIDYSADTLGLTLAEGLDPTVVPPGAIWKRVVKSAAVFMSPKLYRAWSCGP